MSQSHRRRNEEKVIKTRFGLEDGSEDTLEEVGQQIGCDPRAHKADRSQVPAQAASSLALSEAQVSGIRARMKGPYHLFPDVLVRGHE